MKIRDFLLARIADDEGKAQALLADLKAQVAEAGYGSDERGPGTPTRALSAQLWAFYDGQTRRRSFARGQQIAALANPARVLAECEAKRRIMDLAAYVRELELIVDDEFRVSPRDMTTYPYVEETILMALASVYSDHSDYDEEWNI